jgi:hypothetical protein
LKSDEIVIVASLNYAVTVATSPIRGEWKAKTTDGGGVTQKRIRAVEFDGELIRKIE